jgi:Mor family transcriptional regulator
MKVLILTFVFMPLSFSAFAQRTFTNYTCQLSHKQSQNAFYLSLGEVKEVYIGGWNLLAAIKRVDDLIEVSLARSIDIMGAAYQKDAKKTYPLNARALPVQLEHNFGGRPDVFDMICYPRDP